MTKTENSRKVDIDDPNLVVRIHLLGDACYRKLVAAVRLGIDSLCLRFLSPGVEMSRKTQETKILERDLAIERETNSRLSCLIDQMKQDNNALHAMVMTDMKNFLKEIVFILIKDKAAK